MKLQVTQENLSKALNTVARVANTRNTLPILSNILLKTIGNRMTIAATNLDIVITSFVGSKISQEGSITVPARLMQDFISNLPPGVIDLSLEEHHLHIKTDKYQSIINGTPTDEFPVMPTIIKGQKWFLPAEALRQALQQVVMAASTDETRPVLTGVYLHTENAKLYVAATDSHRLAEKLLMKTNENTNLLIPASAMQDLLRIINDLSEDIEVMHDNQQVLFRAGDVELVTRLIEGNYPDYRKLIPKSFGNNAVVNRADFINITKVSSLFARENAGSITIELDEPKQQISIQSIASQLGENNASADAKVTGSNTITLNSRYLLDALNATTSDTVTFGFNGKLEPSVIRNSGSTDYNHVIMPLKS